MKNKILPLVMGLLVLLLAVTLSACSDDVPPPAKTLESPLTETEAREQLQSWLDDHPFDAPVTIDASLTDENETGFVFTLYQTEELARIRVIKDTGAMLRYNPDTNAYTAIDDWHKNLDGYNPPKDSQSGAESPGTSNTDSQTKDSENILEDASAFEYEYDVSLDGIMIKAYIGKNRQIIIPSEIEGYPVVSVAGTADHPDIGSWGKSGFLNLTSVVVPDSVTQIGNFAFIGCESLISVNIPGGVTDIGRAAFSGCSSLTSINIPDSMTGIQWMAFSKCSALTAVNIPNSVTEIGGDVFAGCTSLVSASLPNDLEVISAGLFADCTSLASVEIPDSVWEINERAFGGCTSLTSVILPDGIRFISDNLFANCSSLTSIDIPNGVLSIGYASFGGCTSLETVTLPDEDNYSNFGIGYLTEIGSYAFAECSSLTSINIPGSVTSIGSSSFMGCDSLPLKTQAEIKQHGSRAFD